METKAVSAKSNLTFLMNSLPADAEEWSGMRSAFEESIKWLEKIRDKCLAEAHTALSKTAPAGECPCGSCRAERYLEVITNLTHDELLQIVAAEISVDRSIPCHYAETVPEAGAGSGPSGGCGASSKD